VVASSKAPPIKFRCPECGERLEYGDDAAGTRVRCASCRQRITVPGDDDDLDPEPRSRRRPPASTRLGVVIAALVGGVLLLAGCVVLVIPLTSAVNWTQTSSQFNNNDVHETARWAGEILGPLYTAHKISNGVVREDTLIAERANINAKIKPLIGQAVSWEMGCHVFSTWVSLTPLAFGGDGEAVQLVRTRHPTIVLMDKRPREAPSNKLGDPPAFRDIDVDIPGGISRAEAARLTDRVMVNAKIKEVEIAEYIGVAPWYEGKYYKKVFLLYIYLTDVTIKPVDK
jgi:hypothetical protein